MSRIALAILPLFWPKMPPLGIFFLKSYAQSNKIDVDILDLNIFFYNLADNETKKLWQGSPNINTEARIMLILRKQYPVEYESMINKALSYDVLGFSCFKSNLSHILDFIDILRARKPSLKTILGGPEIARQFFKNQNGLIGRIKKIADFIVIGEGEKPLVDYLRGVKKAKMACFCELPRLDKLAFPDYGGIDLGLYPRPKSAQILFSRGCIRKCAFCSERLLYKKFRVRPVESVIKEIKYHKDRKITHFIFNDSALNADLNRLESLCSAIIDNFGSISWEAQMLIRSDISERLIKKIKKSGCCNIFVGLESGSNVTLKNMNKGFTIQDALIFFKNLNWAGLSFGISVIVGFPGESENDFKESLDFVLKNKNLIPKIEQINPFVYYDGTSVDKGADYRLNPIGARRYEFFVSEIKRHKIKHTNAFLGNLIDK